MTDRRRLTLLARLRSPRRELQALSDSELLVDARTNPEAFGEFFDRQYEPVMAFFGSRIRAADAVGDLCAETLAAALEGIERFDPERGSAEQWLFGIARHKLYRYWRDLRVSRDARDRLGVPDIEVDAATAAAIERVDGEVDPAVVLLALGELPQGQADAVRLRVVDELSYAEIADRLGCRPGAARVRVHRGLHRLREHLEVDWSPEP